MRRTILSLFILIISIASLAEASGRRRASSTRERIEGVITMLSREQVIVRTRHDERQVRMTTTTAVTVDGRKAESGVLRVGDKIAAQLQKESDGTFAAISINSETSSDVQGVVKSASATTLTIDTTNGESSFSLTSETRVLFHARPVLPGAITPGMKAEVHWVPASADMRVAVLVNVHGDFVETEGTVTAVSSDSMTVRAKSGDVTIKITPDTVIVTGEGRAGASLLAVGSQVNVKSLQNSDKSLTAVLVEVQTDGEFVSVKGQITKIATDSVTVKKGSGDEVTVGVNADTIVRRNDERITLKDLKVGDQVDIEAMPSGASLTAVRIEVEQDDNRFAEIQGSIMKITGSVLTIDTKDGKTIDVSVTSATVVRRDDTVLKPADLKVGDAVEIVAKRNADNSLEALFIDLGGQNGDQGGDQNQDDDKLTEFKGKVKSVDSKSITVTTKSGDVTFAIDSSTVVKKNDKPAKLDDLKSGLSVEVRAQQNADKTYLAKVIKIEDDNDDSEKND